jgi:hypothetical protein
MVAFTDSQAALKSLASPRQQSGQFLLRSIIDAVHSLRKQYDCAIEFPLGTSTRRTSASTEWRTHKHEKRPPKTAHRNNHTFLDY